MVRVTLTVPSELADWLRQQAAAHQTSVSAVARALIEKGLAAPDRMLESGAQRLLEGG